MRSREPLTPDKSSKPKSITQTTEYGYYIRKKTRHGKKRRQKTTRIKTNPEKVTLFKIGELEFYVYPFRYPEKIFIGIYPLSVEIEQSQFKRLFGKMNVIRWYFQGDWLMKGDSRNKAKYLRQRIASAYKAGYSKATEVK